MRLLWMMALVLLAGQAMAGGLTREEAQRHAAERALGKLMRGEDVSFTMKAEISPSVAKIGEPIFVQVQLQTEEPLPSEAVWEKIGGFPNMTISVEITGPDGERVADPLYRPQGFIRQGGLGPYRWPELGPGNWQEFDLLNLRGNIETPGSYSAVVTTRFNYAETSHTLTVDPIKFTITKERSRLKKEEASAILSRVQGLDGILIYGLQDERDKIPELVTSYLNRDASLYSMVALSMMDDTEAVLRTFSEQLLASEAKNPPQMEALFYAVTKADDVPMLEAAMDDPRAPVADAAWYAAASLGSGKATELIPAKLAAGQGRFVSNAIHLLFLQVRDGQPLAVEGVELEQRLRRAEELLLAHVRKYSPADGEERMLLAFQLSEAMPKAARLGLESPLPQYREMAWVMLYFGAAPWWRQVEFRPQGKDRDYFGRAAFQELTNRGPSATRAAVLLGRWHIQESRQALRDALLADDDKLRTSAALGLFALGIEEDDPAFETMVDVLAKLLLDKVAEQRRVLMNYGINPYELHLEDSISLMEQPPVDRDQWLRETARLLVRAMWENQRR
jgi:hypothetical protein